MSSVCHRISHAAKHPFAAIPQICVIRVSIVLKSCPPSNLRHPCAIVFPCAARHPSRPFLQFCPCLLFFNGGQEGLTVRVIRVPIVFKSVPTSPIFVICVPYHPKTPSTHATLFHTAAPKSPTHATLFHTAAPKSLTHATLSHTAAPKSPTHATLFHTAAQLARLFLPLFTVYPSGLQGLLRVF